MKMVPSRIGLSLLVISCVLFALCRGQAVQRSSFGEHCNETVKCEKGSWLKCQSSLCACLMEDMIFDTTKGKCVSQPGERCKFQIADTTSDNAGMVLYESTECVANAHCNNGFTCSCDPGHFETVDGKCLEQKDINESCVSSAECKDMKSLFCIQGQCRCAVDHEHIYAVPNEVNYTSMCVTKAGAANTGGTLCIEGTSLENGVCACKEPDYNYPGGDGYCHVKKDFGEACSGDEECQFMKKYLKCVNGKCGCDPTNSLFQTFQKQRTVTTYARKEVINWNSRNAGLDDEGNQLYYEEYNSDKKFKGKWLEQTGRRCHYNCYYYGIINATIETVVIDTLSQCVGLARLPCNPESHCVKNSECVENICSCSKYFSPTSTGTCGIGYGRACSKSTPCSDSFKCTNDICNCPQAQHQIYNNSSKKCIGRVSSFCNEDSDCLMNAVCQVVPETGRKQCLCAGGFVEDMSGKCDKAWNSTCDADDTTPCDTLAQLECRNGFCACADTLTSYDSTRRQCLGVVGARCYRDPRLKLGSLSKNVTECSEGAHCVQMNSNILVAGRCLCQKKFEVKEDMLCHKIAKPKKSKSKSHTTLAPKVEAEADGDEVDTGTTSKPVLVPDSVENDSPASLEVDSDDN